MLGRDPQRDLIMVTEVEGAVSVYQKREENL